MGMRGNFCGFSTVVLNANSVFGAKVCVGQGSSFGSHEVSGMMWVEHNKVSKWNTLLTEEQCEAYGLKNKIK